MAIADNKTRRFNVSCHLFPWESNFMQGIQDISTCGFQACEVGSNFIINYADQIGNMMEVIHDLELSVSAVFEFGHFENWPKRRAAYLHHDRLSRLLWEAKINTVILSPGIKWNRNPDKTHRLRMIETITEIVKRYNHQGIDVSLHPHKGSSIFKIDEIEYVISSVQEQLYLTPDLGQAVEAEMEPLEMLKKYSSIIRSVHLKDAVKQTVTPALRSRGNVRFCELGTGDMDLESVFNWFKRETYTGWLTVEFDKKDGSSLHVAQNSMAYLVDHDIY
jgi:sugar phosphate isomerase/epimerase